MEPDFDVLVEGSRDAHNRTGEQSLWKAALGLDTWYFVADGPGEDAQPVFGALEGKAHLLAFTDADRAEEFSARRARTHGAEPTPILYMEVPDAVAFCRDLMETEVEGVLFNNGAHSFQAPLSRIVDMFGRYRR